MADNLTVEQRRKNMQNIKSKDTRIEWVLRRALWKKGFRYRKNDVGLPGTPDIVFTRYKLAVFCDGEFFHGKDWEVLKARLDKGQNSRYWLEKTARNRQRDEEVNQKLTFAGWTVLRFWGRDILKHTDECVQAIEEILFELKIAEET